MTAREGDINAVLHELPQRPAAAAGESADDVSADPADDLDLQEPFPYPDDGAEVSTETVDTGPLEHSYNTAARKMWVNQTHRVLNLCW